jgi:hypothetical protein
MEHLKNPPSLNGVRLDKRIVPVPDSTSTAAQLFLHRSVRDQRRRAAPTDLCCSMHYGYGNSGASPAPASRVLRSGARYGENPRVLEQSCSLRAEMKEAGRRRVEQTLPMIW